MKTKKRRRFLYISYHYPPVQSIASMRSWKLAKYILDYGWEPTIICANSDSSQWNPKLPDVPIHRIQCNSLLPNSKTKSHKGVNDTSLPDPSAILRSDISFHCANYIYRAWRLLKNLSCEFSPRLDSYPHWRQEATKQGREILKREEIDLILSTSGPFSSHIVAAELSSERKIPWVADYRDLYSLNHSSIKLPLKNWRKMSFERKVMTNASAIVTVSDPLSLSMSRLLHREVLTVPNGFDPEDYQPTELTQTRTGRKFTIIYTGTIYEGKQSPKPLFKAVERLIEDKDIDPDKIEIHFFGTSTRYLRSVLSNRLFNNIVFSHPRVTHKEYIEAQKQSTILLFLNWNDTSEKGITSGKLFEYLGAMRPILAFPQNIESTADEIIIRTKSGIICKDEMQIKETIKEWYDEFYSNGYISYKGIIEEINKYDRKLQAYKFNLIFEQAITKFSKNHAS